MFAFVRSDRRLSTSYIKELHAALLRSQEDTEGMDREGRRVAVPRSSREPGSVRQTIRSGMASPTPIAPRNTSKRKWIASSRYTLRTSSGTSPPTFSPPGCTTASPRSIPFRTATDGSLVQFLH